MTRGFLAGLLLLAACGGERVRPAPLDPTEGGLRATITAPTANDTVGPGTTVNVTVAGQDPTLRSLVGLALVVRRIDEARNQLLDSAAIRFTARPAHDATFTYQIPVTMPFGAIVNVYGVALGSSQRGHESAPRSYFIQSCELPGTSCP